MKYHHVVLSALLLGTGSNVVYDYQNGHQLWRGLASEQVEAQAEVELTIENFSSHIEGMDKRADEIVVLHTQIQESLKEKDLEGLIKVRDESFPELEKKIKAHKKDHKKASAFMDEKIESEQENKVLEDLKNISGILDKVQDIELDVISGDVKENIKKALEEKAIAQSNLIEDLSESVCRQNRELSSLTTKIEDLLEKQEKVFAKVEEEEEAKSQNQLAVDPNLLYQAFASAFTMPAQSFFEAPQPMGLASEANPMGLDMNFLLMTQMLSQSSGFGPRSNVHYAPVYNQQRTYYGMPQMYNDGSFNQESMATPPKGALFPGFNFSRSNGLVEEFKL